MGPQGWEEIGRNAGPRSAGFVRRQGALLCLHSTMVDVFSPAKRSEVMSRIRGKNTKPELLVRSMLHRLGYRFTVNGPLNRTLPGRPDIVLPKYETVILVHGCFWHAHEQCGHYRLPKTRRAWWTKKLEGNRARDKRNEDALLELGWNVVTVWECSLRKGPDRDWLMERLSSWLG
jgi:DNA mismatch endonuclease, patch repair protein